MDTLEKYERKMNEIRSQHRYADWGNGTHAKKRRLDKSYQDNKKGTVYDDLAHQKQYMMATAVQTVQTHFSSSKFFNWIKAAIAVLYTKEEMEPVIVNEVKDFQQNSLNTISSSHSLPAGSTCSNCRTENLIVCPTNRICNAKRGKCSYHKNAATHYRPSGCPNRICHHLKSEIQSAHRYHCPSYKNTDATKWCSNEWEIVKCYLPPDGYKDVSNAGDIDFNGIISVIINHKGFEAKIKDDLSKKNNKFDKGRNVGKAVRHSPNLEVEDTDLTQYFTILNNILTDPGFIAMNKSPNNAIQKLAKLQSDDLMIGKDVVRKVLEDVEKIIQEQIRNEMDEYKQETEKRKLELIDIFNSKVKDIEDKGYVSLAQLNDAINSSIEAFDAKVKHSIQEIDNLAGFANDGVKEINEEKENAIKEIQKAAEKSRGNNADAMISDETYQTKKRGASMTQDRKQTFRKDGNVNVVAKWTLKSADGDERIPDMFDKIFIATVKGQECFIDEYVYEVFREKVRDLLSHIEKKTGGAKANDAKESCVIVNFICRTYEHIKNLLSYFNSDDLKYRLKEIADLILGFMQINVRLSFGISNESLDSIKQTEVAQKTEEVTETCFSETIKDQKKKTRKELDSNISLTEDTRLIRKEGTELDSHISSTKDTYLIRKEELKEDLMRFYKWSHSKVPLLPLFIEKDTPLASFYIRPELNVKTLKDMFKTGDVANREIYLKAEAGLGKTTFSKYLATSWYQAHCTDEHDVPYFEKKDIDCMRDFDFVFLVLLQDSSTSCSVDELIFKLIVSNLANSKSFTKELLQEILSREKCLVILDGLDEWTHPNTQCERAPRSIPHRSVRENCTILTTTRPWKLGALNLSSNEKGKTVELTKLSRDSAETLVRRTLLRLKSPPHNMSIEIDDATLVEEIFKSRVAHLAYVPLLLMYMICLRCEGFNIGNSKCELYVKIVELLLLRTTQKYRNISQTQDFSSSDIPGCFAEHKKCKEYFPLLVHLGQLAYHTLSNKTRENKLVFDGSVTEKYLTPEEMKFTLHSGILSQSTARKLIQKVSKVSFFHKTVQEFFAAIFISFHNDAQKIVLEKCRNILDILDMSIICEFIIEMNADRMYAISNDLMSVINEDEKTRHYRTRAGREDRDNNPLYNIQEMFMSCLQEMPESENIQLCLQDFFIEGDTVQSQQLQRLLHQNKTNIISLYIDVKNASSSLREIIDLASITDFSHLQKLYFDGDRQKDAETNLLLFSVTLKTLQRLNIRNFTLSHKILEIFFNFISGQKSMKELTLTELDCKEDGRHYWTRLNLDLSQHSTLSKLNLSKLPGRLQINISTPSLVNVTLQGINLDESFLLLSRDMLNIERVELREIEMSAGSLQNFIFVLENLPQSVTVAMVAIKPETEYEGVRENIRSSQTFHVIGDYRGRFEFQTRKPSKE